MTYLVRISAFVFALVLILSDPASSESDKIGVWQITCDEGPCQAYFNVERDGSELVSWSIIGNINTGDASMLIRVPQNTALVPGLAVMGPSDEVFKIPFQFCNETGCTAISRISDEISTVLTENEMVRVAFYSYGQPQPIAYEIPVEGFQDVLARLTSKE